jgi:hypothetical protein
MEQAADRPMLNAILVEAAKIAGTTHSHQALVAEGQHDPDKLPFCVARQISNWLILLIVGAY